VIVILGLVILIVVLIVAVVGVLTNSGSGHALPHDFAVFGYHVTGSTGTLFLYGIVVGVAGLLGLGLLLAGARRTSRRGRDARRGLRQSRRETAAVSQDRDNLISQRDTASAQTASTPGSGTTGSDAAQRQGPADGQPAPGAPADAPLPAASTANGSRP
jgi:Sec-independent protein translocase protein TatA